MNDSLSTGQRLFRTAGCLLAVLLGTLSPAWAANKSYCLTVDYSNVPTLVNSHKLTLVLNVGTCASVTVTADGVGVASTYNATAGTATFTTSGVSIVATAVDWTTGGTGAATKASLYNNCHWAYSLTFDDGRQTQYANAKPLLDAKGWKAGLAVVASWTNGGGSYYISWANLKTLRAAGWDIFNHSYDHPNPLTCSNWSNELSQDQSAFQTNFAGYNATHMVFPYETTNNITTCSGFPPSYLLSGECGGNSYNYVDAAFSFVVQRYGMYGTDDTAWKSLAASAAAQTRPTWLVCFTHGVASGSGAAEDAYSTNATTLTDLLNYLNNNYGASGNGSMWFAPAGEVRDYLFTRDKAVVTTCTVASTPTPTSTSTPTRTSTPLSTATSTPTRSFTSTSTPTSSSTPTFTSTRTSTPSMTSTWTASSTSTATRSHTPVFTPTSSNTPVPPTLTQTSSSTPTSTPTRTSTPSFTSTMTTTWTATATATRSNTPTSTNTAVSSTATSTSTSTTTRTSTPTTTGVPPTAIATASRTPTVTQTPSGTSTPTSTFTSTATLTLTATDSFTSTPTGWPSSIWTATSTSTPTSTDSFTPTPTGWWTATWTPTSTSTGTPTTTATVTSTASSTWTALPPSATASSTSTETRTATRTATATDTWTDTATPTPTSTSTASWTPSHTDTATYTRTSTPTPTATWTSTATFTSTSTSSPTPTATFTWTPSFTPTATWTATWTGTATFTSTVTFTLTTTATVTATATFTPTTTDVPSSCPAVILSAPYPNPATSASWPIRFDLRSDCPKTLHWAITTSASRMVVSGVVSVFGRGTLVWDQRDSHGKWVANGLYYFRLIEAGQPDQRAKILILR